MTTCVSSATSAVVPSVRLLGLQLLNLVPEPVKAIILLFPMRGKLDELRKREEAEIKEKGAVPVDPIVFWIKQTVRLVGAARLWRMIIAGSDQQCVRHDLPSTCADKRKMGQISISCCLIHHRIFAVVVPARP